MERIVEVAEQATDRDSAQAARVKVDAYKWVASKLHPQRYGDQLNLNLAGGPGTTPIPLAPPARLGTLIGNAVAAAHAALLQSAEPQPVVIEADAAPPK